jgi:diguanylate cyclase (GGDEF)-like protein
MQPRIRDALQYCPNLPSPPGIAIRIVDLGRDPNVDLTALARLLAKDPALASRILRASNSALYGQRRRSDNLRQAMVVIGLNATMTLALSFSLGELLNNESNSQRGINRYWRRALISATAGRLISEMQNLPEHEETFLAALLQDIGVLALDAAMPEEYRPILSQATDHDQLLELEREKLGTDHGEAGSWLMQHWKLPERVATVASAVHDPLSTRIPTDCRLFVKCVAVAGKVADLFLDDDREASIERLARTASRLIGLEGPRLQDLIARVSEILPEVASLYDTEIVSPRQAAGVTDQARDVLAARNLHLIQQMETQQQQVQEMANATWHLRESANRDVLTGLHNRRRFDEVLETEFMLSSENGWPMTIAFIDLDRFKTVNDTHGHLAGDAVLTSVARVLTSHLRKRDFIMRYGGDEFVAILPGTGIQAAHGVFERLREAVQQQTFEGSHGTIFNITVSVGLASHMDGSRRVGSALDLVRAADRALYEAKGGGRDRIGMDAA